ncbi:ornithine cyclodeaminase family protein [Gemmatimonadota bacterium]
MDKNLRYLSLPDVLAVKLSLDQAIAVVEQSLAEHGRKRVENPPKISVHPRSDSFITAMPAFLPRKGTCGMKWVSGFQVNLQKGLPSISAVIVLNDYLTGFPLAIMDGTWITAVRTVAVSIVAARLLCNEDARTMGIVGCGLQGRYHAVAFNRKFPSLSLLKVFDNYQPSLNSFEAEINKKCPGLKIEVCPSAEAAIRGAQLVVTATGKLLEPVFLHEWVEPGAMVLPVHTFGWEPSTPVAMDRFVVDDRGQFSEYSQGWYHSLPKKQPTETGEIVVGFAPGRLDHEERIINFNTGLAVHDILMAKSILERAEEKGIGTLLPTDAAMQLPELDL